MLFSLFLINNTELLKMNSCETFIDANDKKDTQFPNPDKCLLWKLSLKRKDAFEAMNDDVDEIVNECLKARRRLQAVEDKNRNLHAEVRSLRAKYESLLEKNKNDTGIIMRLKDSESTLKQVRKNLDDASEALMTTKMKNKGKLLERRLLSDNLATLLFKSQTVSNRINKINLKHKRAHDMIEEENKRCKENEKRLVKELEELRLNLSKDDNILEKWQKNNTERDAAIRNLQDDIKEGLTVKALEGQEESENQQDSTNEETSATEESETELSVIKDKSSEEKVDSKEVKSDDINEKKKAFHWEWLRKKVLYEVAEKQKEHWIGIFMLINKRMQDLSIEVVNVREWRIDLDAQKRELLKKAEELENLVSQKRRKKPIPARQLADELSIWIKVQHETNETLRKILSKCLSIKVQDLSMFSDFAKTIRDIYLDTLRKQLTLESDSEKQTSEEQTTEAEDQT